MKRSWSVTVCVVIGLVVVVGLSVVFLIILSQNDSSERNVASLPSIEIELNDTTIDEINQGGKEEKYEGNKIVFNSNEGVATFNNVEFKGRGNASWQTKKKSYRIKLDKKTDLLGLGKAKKWGLISNYIDDTMMRNDLAYYIAHTVDNNYQIGGEYVDLSVDGKALGTYYLVKLIEIGKTSVDIREPMGVLVELDNAYCNESEVWVRTDSMNDCLVLSDAVSKGDEANEAWEDFVETYNKYESAIKKLDYKEANKYMDMKSLAQYFLVNEFASNPDMFVTSWYMYKDGLDDKIHCVLAWDFDAAFGNRNWGEWLDVFYSPKSTMARLKYSIIEIKENDDEDNKDEKSKGNENGGTATEYVKEEKDRNDGNCKKFINAKPISAVLCYAFNTPEFKLEVDRQYVNTLKNKREEILNYIEKRASYIRESAIKNNKMWELGDFDEAVGYLEWWVEERFDYFNENYTGEIIEDKMLQEDEKVEQFKDDRKTEKREDDRI